MIGLIRSLCFQLRTPWHSEHWLSVYDCVHISCVPVGPKQSFPCTKFGVSLPSAKCTIFKIYTVVYVQWPLLAMLRINNINCSFLWCSLLRQCIIFCHTCMCVYDKNYQVLYLFLQHNWATYSYSKFSDWNDQSSISSLKLWKSQYQCVNCSTVADSTALFVYESIMVLSLKK